jgi:hypothetical protein
MIPFCTLLRDAEGNFKKAEIKKVSEKRRRRLDMRDGIDRESHEESFVQLDKIYRVTEKEEIKKYMEVGKTAKDYYADKDARIN